MQTHSAELDQLAAALAAAQGEFSAVPRDQTNDFFNSRYADLASVVAAASPILAAHGLAVTQWIGTDQERRDTLTTWLLHTSGQYIASATPLKLNVDKDGRETSQAHGSAVTYARRYSYMAALGLVADADDDGNAASQPRAGAPAHATSQPPPAARSEVKASPAQVRMMFARSKDLRQMDRDTILSHVIGVSRLEDVPQSRIDELLHAFTQPVPPPPPDAPPDTEGLPEPGGAPEAEQDDIPF